MENLPESMTVAQAINQEWKRHYEEMREKFLNAQLASNNWKRSFEEVQAILAKERFDNKFLRGEHDFLKGENHRLREDLGI